MEKSAPLLMKPGDLFFWNKSHLEHFIFNEGLLDHQLSLSYSGKNPYSVVEHLATVYSNTNTPENFRKALNHIWSRSYTFYDYFDHNSFRVNNVVPKFTKEVAAILVQKFKSENIIVLDIDTEALATIYQYGPTVGLNKSYLHEFEAGLDGHKHVTESVQDIITNALVGTIADQIRMVNSERVCWLLTGDALVSANSDIEGLILRLFSKFKELPLQNEIYLDQFHLFNYLHRFPTNIIKEQSRLWFKKVPLSILNWSKIPFKTQLSIQFESGEAQTVYPDENGGNIFEVNEDGKIAAMPNMRVRKGYVWFWQKNDAKYFEKLIQNHRGEKGYLFNLLSLKRLKHVENLHNLLNLHKFSRFTIAVSPAVYNSAEVGKKLSFQRKNKWKKDYFQKFMHTPHLDKEDLLILNGQKVTKGEKINRSRKVNFIFETKELLAPASGILSSKYIDSGFISIKTKDYQNNNFEWLDNKDVIVNRKRDNNILELITPTVGLPLVEVQGVGYSGTILCANKLSDAFEYINSIISCILVCNFSIEASELMELLCSGARAVIAPTINDLSKLPPQYSQIFTYGQYSSTKENFPVSIQRYLFLNQNNWGYLDPVTNELKIIPQSVSEENKFYLSGSAQAKRKENIHWSKGVLKKGSNVLVNLKEYLLDVGEIKYIDGDRIILLLEDGTIVQLSRSQVTLLLD